MSKIFHCRCAVAIKLANRDNDANAKIIAFDESHIEDVKVQLSGFNSAVGVASQSNLNPSFAASRYAQHDSTVSVTINETALDASWLSLLDVAYTAVGGKAIDLTKDKEKFQSIYDVNAIEIPGSGNKKVSDPDFLIEENKKLLLEALGKGLKPQNTQSQHKSFLDGIKDESSFKNTLKSTLDLIKKSKDATQLKTQKDNLSVILTIGKQKGFELELGGGNPPSTRPIQPTQNNPAPVPSKESYGKIILTLDHSKTGGGAGADGKERTITDQIARYIKNEIERKEPKIKVEIKGPEDVKSGPYRICNRKNPGPGCKNDPECREPYDSDWDEYDNYIVKEYVNNKEAKATIIGIHLDAPVGEGGSGAAVYNLEQATEVSNKLSNIISGTYINKFKVTSGQAKVGGVKRWNRCKNRSLRLYQNAPEGYALIEFGVFRAVERQGFQNFIKEQKEAFSSLIEGLIQFKKSFGTSNNVPATTQQPGQDSGQLKLPEIGPKPGLLVSFWYEVNGYVSKVDYYFIITSASITFGDGTPKLNLAGNSAFSVIFNTWKIQDSFSAGTPVDEALRKIFSSDPTNTFSSQDVQFDTENPKEKLYQQEDIAGLTYAEFLSKLARKFDLQYLSSARTDQIGKIKIFRETRGGSFDGSQVFWLGRGLFEKYEISVVSDIGGYATVADQTSNYSQASLSGNEGSGGSPFLPSDRVNFKMPTGQPSMLKSVNGREYIQSNFPPPGWERIERSGTGIQVVLKLPNGTIWPKSGNLELHNYGQSRPGRYDTQRSLALWDPRSQTFKIKSGRDYHPATDGGLSPAKGAELIAYFKGITVGNSPSYGGVKIKYNRWIRVEVNGEEKECQLFHQVLHMTNVIKTGTPVDIGTKIGNQSDIGSEGSPHMHEEFYINVSGKTLYLDPFIVYNYSYSKDASGNITFDSAARVGSVATGPNNPGSGYQSGTKSGQGNTLVLRTEFTGIPRALQILPGQTFLHFVTDYNRYLTIDDKNKKDVDPGIPIIKQLRDWMIVKSTFNWTGDLKVEIEAHRPRTDVQIYYGQNWQHYRLNPGKGGQPLNDYYDYIRSIGDLSYRTVDENGNIISSFDSKLKNIEWMTGYSGGSSSSNPNSPQPSVVSGKCKYVGNWYKNDKPFIDEVAGQLSNQGFNRIAVAGILGNISVESALGKSLVGGEGTCAGADSRLSGSISAKLPNGQEVEIPKGSCFGIVQWGGGRKINAINFIKGSNWTYAAHAAYVVKELRENERTCQCNNRCSEFGKPMIDLLNNAKSAADAARIFRVCYERPSADDSQKRQGQANIIFQGLKCEG